MAKETGRSLLWQYIRENLGASLAIWRQGEGMSVLVGALIALVFAALGFWGFDVQWQPNAATWWVQLLGAWFLMLVVLVTPFRMWKAQHLRIEQLEAEKLPSIIIECGSDPDFVRTTHMPSRNSAHGIVGMWVRLRVTNKGSQFARECRALLMDIQQVTSSGDLQPMGWADPLPLKWSNQPDPSLIAGEKADLLPETPKYVDIFEGHQGNSFFYLKSVPPKIAQIMPGDYWLKVRVVGDGCRSEDFQCNFRWDGRWETIELEPA